MAKAKDLSKRVFNRLTVRERIGTAENGSALWLCDCDCGNTKIATTAHLTGGFIQSCGCLKSEVSARNNKSRAKHNARSRQNPVYGRLYSVWNNMRNRCENPNCHAYEDYGKRGIAVCDEWKSFESFKEWAIKAGYDVKAEYGACTLDRKDNDDGYNPQNCRWVSMKEQAENRRNIRGKDGKYLMALSKGGQIA